MTPAETLALFTRQFGNHLEMEGGGMVILADRQPLFHLGSLRCRAVTEADEDRFPGIELGTTQWFFEEGPGAIAAWIWEP